jgi:hypothetical protein
MVILLSTIPKGPIIMATITKVATTSTYKSTARISGSAYSCTLPSKFLNPRINHQVASSGDVGCESQCVSIYRLGQMILSVFSQ